MPDTVPALLPLAILEAVQNIDTPPDDGLGALEHELAAKRLGLSATVTAQIGRYRVTAAHGGNVDREEALAVFRLVGRRPDAELVYADAGRRAARHAVRHLGATAKSVGAVAPGRLGRSARLRSAARLAERWLLVEATPTSGLLRAEVSGSLPMAARDDGVGCRFYTAALGELLRLVAHIEGAMDHEACQSRGDRRCVWRAERAEGYE